MGFQVLLLRNMETKSPKIQWSVVLHGMLAAGCIHILPSSLFLFVCFRLKQGRKELYSWVLKYFFHWCHHGQAVYYRPSSCQKYSTIVKEVKINIKGKKKSNIKKWKRITRPIWGNERKRSMYYMRYKAYS